MKSWSRVALIFFLSGLAGYWLGNKDAQTFYFIEEILGALVFVFLGDKE